MRLRLLAGCTALGLALLAACSGDVEVDPAPGDDDDDTLPSGFDASTRRDSGGSSSSSSSSSSGGSGGSSSSGGGGSSSGGGGSSGSDAGLDSGADAPCTCTSPPVAACNGRNLVTYPAAGTCPDDACIYQPSSQQCELGCSEGACAVDALTFLGLTKGFVTDGPQIPLALTSGGMAVPTIAPANTVSITTQTFGRGTVQEIHVAYGTNPQLTDRVDVAMTFDRRENDNDQFFAVLPAQPAGTQVYFYVQATSYAGASLYDPSTFQVLLTYKVQ